MPSGPIPAGGHNRLAVIRRHLGPLPGGFHPPSCLPPRSRSARTDQLHQSNSMCRCNESRTVRHVWSQGIQELFSRRSDSNCPLLSTTVKTHRHGYSNPVVTAGIAAFTRFPKCSWIVKPLIQIIPGQVTLFLPIVFWIDAMIFNLMGNWLMALELYFHYVEQFRNSAALIAAFCNRQFMNCPITDWTDPIAWPPISPLLAGYTTTTCLPTVGKTYQGFTVALCRHFPTLDAKDLIFSLAHCRRDRTFTVFRIKCLFLSFRESFLFSPVKKEMKSQSLEKH